MDPMHKNFPDDGYFTRNYTSDPKYPPGSYYESMGWKGYPHNTNIYGPDGGLIDQTNPGSTLDSARNIIFSHWRDR